MSPACDCLGLNGLQSLLAPACPPNAFALVVVPPGVQVEFGRANGPVPDKPTRPRWLVLKGSKLKVFNKRYDALVTPAGIPKPKNPASYFGLKVR